MEERVVESKKKKKTYKAVIEQITGIFLPIINCLTAASIVKSAIILLAAGGFMDKAGGLYQVLYAAGDGFFYFLPFYLAYTASKQWKTDPFISMMIPVTMLYPELNAIIEGGGSLNFLGLNIPNNVYHSSVLPVIMAVGLLYFVEKPCDKYIPEAVRGILKPIICMLTVLPVTLLFLGSIGTWIGNFLTEVFLYIYNFSPVFAGAFMGFFIQPMVVVGAHWSIVPICISNISTIGYDMIMPLVGGAVYGQAGVCLGLALLSKKNAKKRQLAYQGFVSSILGVTEPALYGVTVPNMRAMITACIAGAIGGALAGTGGIHCTSFAFPSFVTCIAFAGPGFVTFLLSMVVSFVIAFILILLQKKWLKCNEMEENEANTPDTVDKAD